MQVSSFFWWVDSDRQKESVELKTLPASMQRAGKLCLGMPVD